MRYFLFVLFLFCSNYLYSQGLGISKSGKEEIHQHYWKVHIGDTTDWKRPVFDDSRWQTINRTMFLIDSLSVLPRGTFWYRTLLSIDSSQIDEVYELQCGVVGACEVYLDGLKIAAIGYEGKKRVYRVTLNPEFVGPLYFEKAGTHLLAVRYTYPDLQEWYNSYKCNLYSVGFSAKVFLKKDSQIDTDVHNQIINPYISSFTLGILIFLLIFYVVSINFQTNQIENFTTVGILLAFITLNVFNIWDNVSKTVYVTFLLLKCWTPLCAVIIMGQSYLFFRIYGNNKWKWFVLAATSSLISFSLVFIDNSYHFWKHSYALIFCYVVLQLPLPLYLVVILYHFFGKNGLWQKIVCWSICCGVVFILINTAIENLKSPHNFTIVLLNLMIVTFFSVLRIANTNRDTILRLYQKLIEVQSLSDEKQDILTKQNIMLEQQVEIRTAELKESNKAKDFLFSVISHDLRNPLLSLKMLLEMLQDKTITKEQFYDLSNHLSVRLKVLNETLENLLNWSLGQRNQIQTKPEYLDIEPIIEDSIDLYETMTSIKNIQFDKNMLAGIKVYFDKNHLQIILRNLLHNAIKFSLNDKPVKIIIVLTKEFTELTIINTYNDDTQPKTKQHKNKGAGLGLLLCKELAEKNGGSLNIADNDHFEKVVIVKIPN